MREALRAVTALVSGPLARRQITGKVIVVVQPDVVEQILHVSPRRGYQVARRSAVDRLDGATAVVGFKTRDGLREAQVRANMDRGRPVTHLLVGRWRGPFP